MNQLWYGDNITIMQNMKMYSVDLIYLDPPFKSDTNYNLLYKNMTGKPVPEQAEAFFDTWTLDAVKLEIARTMPVLMKQKGVDDYYVQFWRMWMNALRYPQPELMAYLIYMVQRLLYMKGILKPTGSIYLHCDPTASHYIKIMMDAIFGHKNFQNEIIWKRTSAHNSARRWGPVHDVILFYTASDKFTWNKLYQPYDPSYVNTRFKRGDERPWKDADLTGSGVRNGETGEVWRGFDVTAKGRHWAYPPSELERMDAEGEIYWPKKVGGWPRKKVYLDTTSGIPIQDVWTDIQPINSQAQDRLGYPTQKPVPLLDRIIQASTNPGDVVFDPFCGCGTTIYSAIKNQRKWIGCDIAILSVKLIREQLTGEKHRLVEGHDFIVDGIPNSVDSAQVLFSRDPFQFQHWLVERIGGFPMQKKVADRGIDGRIYFETREGLSEVILSVKGGKLRPTDVRDLRGVLEREKSAMAGLLSLHEPSKSMKAEAAAAGMYEYNGLKYPRIQLLTVREILEDKREFQMPTRINAKNISGQQSLPL